jgi:Fe-S metabolism associated domain
LLLEFSEELPPLPARYAGHRDLLEQVPECQTPLFLAVEVDGGGTVHLFFDARRSPRPPAASPASSTRASTGSPPMRSWRHRASSPPGWGSMTW